ncbi:MAG: hypothetical protein K6G89_05075 [Clostridia bacterium]|nr:hypothetical protein [Clostridia bacterium]
MTEEIGAKLTPEGSAPLPDEDILKLKSDFKEFCGALETEEDNAGDVYEKWAGSPSVRLSNLTPFEFIKKYVGAPPDLNRYESLVLSMLSDPVCSVPGSVLDDFFGCCNDPAGWRESLLEECLDRIGNDSGDTSESTLILIYKLSELSSDYSGKIFNKFLSTAEKLMPVNGECASELLTLPVYCCENGFEKTLELLSEKAEQSGAHDDIRIKMLAVACVSGKKDDRLYVLLRSLVKRTDIFDDNIKLYFMMVRDYGDPRAVSFMRTKVGRMKEVYDGLDGRDGAAKKLFDAAYLGDGVIRSLGGEGYF